MTRRCIALTLTAALSLPALPFAAQPSPDALRQAAAAGSVRAHFELARLLAKEGQGEAALAEMSAALGLAPSSEELIDGFARLALGLGRPLQALPALEALARLDPGNAEAAYLLGVCRLQLGDPAAAEALQRATELRPDKPLSFTALGLARNLEKRYELAEKALGEALALNPGDLESEAALAEAEEGLGKIDAAAARAEKVLAKAPRHRTAQLVRGLVAMERQEWQQARDIFEALAAEEPGAARVQYQASLACARLGDLAAAERHRKLYEQANAQQQERLEALRGVHLPGGEDKP